MPPHFLGILFQSQPVQCALLCSRTNSCQQFYRGIHLPPPIVLVIPTLVFFYVLMVDQQSFHKEQRLDTHIHQYFESLKFCKSHLTGYWLPQISISIYYKLYTRWLSQIFQKLKYTHITTHYFWSFFFICNLKKCNNGCGVLR